MMEVRDSIFTTINQHELICLHCITRTDGMIISSNFLANYSVPLPSTNLIDNEMHVTAGTIFIVLNLETPSK